MNFDGLLVIFLLALYLWLRAGRKQERKRNLRESINMHTRMMIVNLRQHNTCCGANACNLQTECNPGNCGACPGNRPCGGAYPRSICPRKANCDLVAECMTLLRENVPDSLLHHDVGALVALDREFKRLSDALAGATPPPVA